MLRISTFVDKGIIHNDALPEHVRHSALPFVVASLPVFIGSVAGAYIVMPLLLAVTSYLLYTMAKSTDEFMFSFDKQRARAAVTIPLCGFIAAWTLVLTAVGRTEMMNGVVGPFCILLLIACAPAYRWKAHRQARRVPLWISFLAAGSFSVLAALAHVSDIVL